MVKEFENLTVEQIGARIKDILSEGRNRLNITSTLFSNYYPRGKKTFCDEGPCSVVSFSLEDTAPMSFDVYEERILLPDPLKIKGVCKKKHEAAVRGSKVLIEQLKPDGSGDDSLDYAESLKKSVEEEENNFKSIMAFISEVFEEINTLLEGEGFLLSKVSRKGSHDIREYGRGV